MRRRLRVVVASGLCRRLRLHRHVRPWRRVRLWRRRLCSPRVWRVRSRWLRRRVQRIKLRRLLPRRSRWWPRLKRPQRRLRRPSVLRLAVHRPWRHWPQLVKRRTVVVVALRHLPLHRRPFLHPLHVLLLRLGRVRTRWLHLHRHRHVVSRRLHRQRQPTMARRRGMKCPVNLLRRRWKRSMPRSPAGIRPRVHALALLRRLHLQRAPRRSRRPLLCRNRCKPSLSHRSQWLPLRRPT